MKWSKTARRRWRFRLVALASFLLPVGLSAGAGVAPAEQPKPSKPQTLVATYGKIYAFAQDVDATGRSSPMAGLSSRAQPIRLGSATPVPGQGR